MNQLINSTRLTTGKPNIKVTRLLDSHNVFLIWSTRPIFDLFWSFQAIMYFYSKNEKNVSGGGI